MLSYRFQKAGWWLLLVSVVCAALCVIFESIDIEADAWVRGISVPSGLMSYVFFYLSLILISISREKNEDEYILSRRIKVALIVVVYALVIKMIASLMLQICIRMGYTMEFGEWMSFFNITTNVVVLTVSYIIIFKLMLFVESLKLKRNNEQ